MTSAQTISWIFLATAVASQTGPADLNSISNVADRINHAVPTQQELQASLSWLTKNDLVKNIGGKYKLTERGQSDYDVASRRTSALLKIWDNLDAVFEKYQFSA